jgi:ABC-type branched-subunit amino acid transport system permease subunit
MDTALIFYVANLAVFWCIFNILAWGLNIQFGYSGVINFAYIIFVAAGAYVAGVLMLGPASENPGREYILGLHLPFVIALPAAGAAAGGLGALVGLVALRRLRSDYLGITTVAAATIALSVVSNYTPLFNGFDGLAGVPEPFNVVLGMDTVTYAVFYVVVCAAVMAVALVVANRIGNSPLGRSMRATREDLEVAEAFGKNTFRLRMLAMVIGCVYAGLGGALLVGYVGAFNPGAWSFGETFLIYAALLVGGRGNNWGSILGVLLVIVIFFEGTRFLPPIPDRPELIPSLRNGVIAILLILTLWFRPQGVVPEARRRLLAKAKSFKAN